LGLTGLRRRVLEKVPEKVLGGFGAEPWPGSTGFWRRFWRRSGRLWCRARSGSTGFVAIYFTETQLRCFQHASERFVQIKRRGCWGYHPSILVYPRVSPRSVGFASCGIEALGCSTNHSPIPDLEVSEREKCL